MRSGRLAETPVSFFFIGRALLLARREPSTVWGFGADGSGFMGWTFHGCAPYRGWFGYWVLNLPCWRSISRMVQYPGANLPRLGPESRTVRVSCVEPSTVGADIVDGSMSMAGPSTLMPHIADGSGSMCWTFHVSVPYRGWFSIQARTFHA